MSARKRKIPQYGMLSFLHDRSCNTNISFEPKLLRERLAYAKNLFRKDLKSHFGCVNAIEFSHNGGEWFASGGDDRRILLWHTESALDELAKPQSMQLDHNSNIFCLTFDLNNQRIFSGGNDELVIVHDIESGGKSIDVYKHEEAIYGLANDPLNKSVFASACADGRVLIYDIRSPASKDPFCLANYMHAMHGVMYNPSEPRLIVTANAKEGISLWDIRKPRSCLLQYGSGQQSCMSVRFNMQGDQILALRRRMPPVIYSTQSPDALYQFDHSGYYNSCTMKSCCFAGENDQYVMSGSDDFNLYMWKIPDEPSDTSWIGEAHMVLHDHRSIVNQVRFNPTNQLVLSSGVEKVIKAWSLFPIPYSKGDLLCDEDLSEGSVRPVYTHEEYINLVLRSGLVMSHDYSQQSMEEDPRMMAFFDSLVQREVEGWSSTEDELDLDLSHENRSVLTNNEDGDTSSSGEGSPQRPEGESDNERSHSPFTVAFASVMARQELANEESAESERLNRRESDGMLVGLVLADEVMNLRDESSLSANNQVDTPGLVEAREQSASADSAVLPGQEPTTSRRTISYMISQKRKEYLASLKQHKQRQKRKRKLMVGMKRSYQYSDSSSESTSSASESFNDYDSSSSESSHSQAPMDEVMTSLTTALKTGNNEELQRIKRLRGIVEKEDCTSVNISQQKSTCSVGQYSHDSKLSESYSKKGGANCDEGSACESGPHLFSEDRPVAGPSWCHKSPCERPSDKETDFLSLNEPLNTSKYNLQNSPKLSNGENLNSEPSCSFSWSSSNRYKRRKRNYRSDSHRYDCSSSDDDS